MLFQQPSALVCVCVCVLLCGLCGRGCESGPKLTGSLRTETTMRAFRKCQLWWRCPDADTGLRRARRQEYSQRRNYPPAKRHLSCCRGSFRSGLCDDPQRARRLQEAAHRHVGLRFVRLSVPGERSLPQRNHFRNVTFYSWNMSA